MNHYYVKINWDINFSALPEAMISYLPSDTDPYAGDEIEIYCDVTGTPRPQITWLRDSFVLGSTSNIHISSNNARLRIAMATQDNSGEYMCVATNNAGSVNDSIRMDIQSMYMLMHVRGIII